MKTNIGHLESAAGIAGLIKVLLAMKHGMIPKHLHFDNPNPHMDWDALPVRVTSEATAWPLVSARPRRAGVSAFALSGTNAHVLVEGYGAPEEGSTLDARRGSPASSAQPVAISLPESVPESQAAEGMRPRRTRMLPLSGKSDDALRESAGRYLSWLDECAGELSSEGAAAEPLLSDMAWTAAVGRSHFAHRAGVVFEDAASLREGLRAIEESDELPKPQAAARVAFAYAGESGHGVGMGEELYESEPVARAVLDRCDEVIRVERGASAAGRDVRPIWRSGRSGVVAAGGLCARVHAHNALGERRDSAERGVRRRCRRSCGGACGGLCSRLRRACVSRRGAAR